jgi:hypothetical protein
MLPSNAPAAECPCDAPLRLKDVDHGMWCASLAAHTPLRRNIQNRILRRVVHRAGIASTQDPPLLGLTDEPWELAALLAPAPGFRLKGTSSSPYPGASASLTSLSSTPNPSALFQQRQLRPVPLLLDATNRRSSICEQHMHEWSQPPSRLCPSPWRAMGT